MELRGLKFIFAAFGIAFMLIIFYVWVQKEVTTYATQQAEITASDIELKEMFSELLHEKGTELLGKNNEEIIEEYSKQKMNLPKGSYDADCKTTGIDKECTLTITLHETLGAVMDWTLFMSAARTALTFGITLPETAALVAVKLIASNAIKVVEQQAYLPKDKQAVSFKLKTRVTFA